VVLDPKQKYLLFRFGLDRRFNWIFYPLTSLATLQRDLDGVQLAHITTCAVSVI
jgi:hypothetical protein